MEKIEVDSNGNVIGNPEIKNGEPVQFQAALGSNTSCLLEVKFKKFNSKNEKDSDAASAGTIKIGS